MRYVIEDTVTNLYGKEQTSSYLIEGPKVIHCSNYFSRYTHIRLHTEEYILTPGFVMLDFTIGKIEGFSSFKERLRHLQNIGCTTFITTCDVLQERNFELALKKAKHALINSSIDYLIAMKVPLSKLTQTMVRKCCKSKVPLLFIEITDEVELYSTPWQWIRNELFPYQLILVPVWNISGSKRYIQKLKTEWSRIALENKFMTQEAFLDEHTPLDKQFLQNLGLYPMKGSMQQGTDADYLLFKKAELSNRLIDITQSVPEIVYANGIVKKAGSNLIVQPGSGKELIIKVPRKFTPIEKAFQPAMISIDYF